MPSRRSPPALILLLAVLPVAAVAAWPPAVVNPRPQPDDVLVALPCGGAMAFRRLLLPAPGSSPAGFDRLSGPFQTPAGESFLMMGKYEVAVRQYRAVRAYALGQDCPPAAADDAVAKGGVSWKEAASFGDDWHGWMITAGREFTDCTGLGGTASASPCIPRVGGRPATVRLPTEAEWEFAARGGLAVTPEQFSASRYPMTGPIEAHAWISGNARGAVQPIGQLRANPLGLHDLYGNVAEIMAGTAPGETRFGTAPVFTLRGGSRYSGAAEVGSSARQQASLYDVRGRKHTSDAGFRLVIGDVHPLITPGPLRPADRVGVGIGSEPAVVQQDGRAAMGAPSRPLGSPALTLSPLVATLLGLLAAGLGIGAGLMLGRASKRRSPIPRQVASADAGEPARRTAGKALEAARRQAARQAADRQRGADAQHRTPQPAAAGAPASRQAPETERPDAASRGDVEGQAPPIAKPRPAAPRRPYLLRKIHPFDPDMIALPGGTFWMGSPDSEVERWSVEGPQHQVTVQPFAIGRYAVAFAEYDRFAEATGRRKPHDHGWGRGNRPVVSVAWNDAVAYAAWLSEQTGAAYRLPTEAEWEYAARAGTTTAFWTGECIHTDNANYNGNHDYGECGATTGVYRRETLPVGSLPANPWGLHEVAGNVDEWTADCWHESYNGAPNDGSVWGDGDVGDCARRVVRGGGWNNNPWRLRSASRNRYIAHEANLNIGFRLATTFP